MLKKSRQQQDGMYREFKAKWKKAAQEFEDVTDEKSYGAERKAKRFLIPLINKGQELSRYILEHKDIPDRHTKDLEMATRAFLQVRRRPYKPKTWIQKKERRIKFLLKTRDFPEKKAGTDKLFDVGPFEVHNTVGAEGKELEILKEMIEKATRFVERSPVPNSSDLLYGKIFLTGRLQQAHTIAWYHREKDQISIKTKKSMGPEQLRALIHEMGHRLWTIFLDRDVKRQWMRWHSSLKYKSPDVPLPKEGEPLGFDLKGLDDPVIQRIDGDRYYVSEDGYLTINQIYDAYTREFSYPTPYSATSKEEHFCEAFSLYCMDTLDSDHKEKFEHLIIQQNEFERE